VLTCWSGNNRAVLAMLVQLALLAEMQVAQALQMLFDS
jgi:hypothetical protein